MTVIKIEGRNLREALERAKEELGDGAVVISRKRGKAGVVLAVSQEAPKSPVALLSLRQEARSMFASKPEVNRPNTSGLERCLKNRGASKALIKKVCESIGSKDAKGRHPLDLAGAELSHLFPIAKAPHSPGKTSIMAFVGASGAGKTTTLAKLAQRLVASGRSVALVTLDVYRVGAVEQVRALGKHVSCKTHAAREILQVRGLLRGAKRPDVILLDCTGRPDKDGSALRKFQRALAEEQLLGHLSVYLIAEATMRPTALEEEMVRLGPLPMQGCIVTKTDETRRPAPVLEYLAKKKLGIAFLCNGRDLKTDFYRASGDAFANLMLKGKVN